MRERVTVLNQTPSAFRALVARRRARRQARRGALCARYVIFGGEALDVARPRAVWDRRTATSTPQLVNMYGITETTVHVTYRPLRREPISGRPWRSVIGEPIPDLAAHVLDRARPTRRRSASPGELYVGGAGVWRAATSNRPELTAERFVPDPFATRRARGSTGRGDLARRCAGGGTSSTSGRADQQVKIRGFRIELGEIEARSTRHPACARPSSLAREDVPGDRRLVAYVVAQSPARRRRRAVRCARSFRAAAAGPHGAVGVRLARRAAAHRERQGGPRARCPRPISRAWRAPARAPREADEEAIAAIFAEVLGRAERAARTHGFFDLGGHSLLATQVLARLPRRSACELPVRALFEAPTIAELAGRVDALARAQASGRRRLRSDALLDDRSADALCANWT